MGNETEKPAGNTDKGSGKTANHKQGVKKFEGREEKPKG